MALPAKMAITDLQWYHWNLYLINNVKNIVVLLGLKVFISDNSSMISCSRNARTILQRNHNLKYLVLRIININI